MTHKFLTWDTIPLEEMSNLISRKVVTGEKAMLAHIYLKKDAVVPEHHHESEQITYIVEGALKFELEGREVTVRKGEVLLIPSNVPHRAVALEDTIDIDVFAPIRMDWVNKTDSYLRRGEREFEPDEHAVFRARGASRNARAPLGTVDHHHVTDSEAAGGRINPVKFGARGGRGIGEESGE